MRTVYRVTVAAVKYDDEGNFVADETLFEATHHRPEALLRFAPTEVDDALRVVAGVEVATMTPPAAPIPAATWDAVATDPEPQAVDEPASQSEPEAADDKPKRKRRTKAEIEADKAREAALATGAASYLTPDAAVVASEVTEEFEGAVPVSPGEPEVTAPQPASPVAPEPVAASAPAAAAPAADGAPWNPFLQR